MAAGRAGGGGREPGEEDDLRRYFNQHFLERGKAT